jgi:Tfp pilus assembly protein FimV
MTDQEIVNFKLSLAKAWLENGHEDMARDLVRSIIEKAEGQNE